MSAHFALPSAYSSRQGPQRVDIAIKRGGQPREHVGEAGVWFEVADLGCGEQAHDRGSELAAVREPANSQFLRPIAMGRIAFSIGLLSIGGDAVVSRDFLLTMVTLYWVTQTIRNGQHGLLIDNVASVDIGGTDNMFSGNQQWGVVSGRGDGLAGEPRTSRSYSIHPRRTHTGDYALSICRGAPTLVPSRRSWKT